MSELRHKIKMMTMQVEEAENLKFDIEILNDEKTMMDTEINEMKTINKDLEK